MKIVKQPGFGSSRKRGSFTWLAIAIAYAKAKRFAKKTDGKMIVLTARLSRKEITAIAVVFRERGCVYPVTKWFYNNMGPLVVRPLWNE